MTYVLNNLIFDSPLLCLDGYKHNSFTVCPVSLTIFVSSTFMIVGWFHNFQRSKEHICYNIDWNSHFMSSSWIANDFVRNNISFGIKINFCIQNLISYLIWPKSNSTFCLGNRWLGASEFESDVFLTYLSMMGGPCST